MTGTNHEPIVGTIVGEGSGPRRGGSVFGDQGRRPGFGQSGFGQPGFGQNAPGQPNFGQAGAPRGSGYSGATGGQSFPGPFGARSPMSAGMGAGRGTAGVPPLFAAMREKSVLLAGLLALLLGPLGMIYSTLPGFFVTGFLTLVVTVITLGHGWFFFWPLCVMWAVMATMRRNQMIRSLRAAGF